MYKRGDGVAPQPMIEIPLGSIGPRSGAPAGRPTTYD